MIKTRITTKGVISEIAQDGIAEFILEVPSNISGSGPATSELGDLTDVNVTGVQDGDALVYNEALSQWEPGQASGASALTDLTDVDLTGLQDGQVIAWDEDEGLWTPVSAPPPGDIFGSPGHVAWFELPGGALSDDSGISISQAKRISFVQNFDPTIHDTGEVGVAFTYNVVDDGNENFGGQENNFFVSQDVQWDSSAIVLAANYTQGTGSSISRANILPIQVRLEDSATVVNQLHSLDIGVNIGESAYAQDVVGINSLIELRDSSFVQKEILGTNTRFIVHEDANFGNITGHRLSLDVPASSIGTVQGSWNELNISGEINEVRGVLNNLNFTDSTHQNIGGFVNLVQAQGIETNIFLSNSTFVEIQNSDVDLFLGNSVAIEAQNCTFESAVGFSANLNLSNVTIDGGFSFPLTFLGQGGGILNLYFQELDENTTFFPFKIGSALVSGFLVNNSMDVGGTATLLGCGADVEPNVVLGAGELGTGITNTLNFLDIVAGENAVIEKVNNFLCLFVDAEENDVPSVINEVNGYHTYGALNTEDLDQQVLEYSAFRFSDFGIPQLAETTWGVRIECDVAHNYFAKNIVVGQNNDVSSNDDIAMEITDKRALKFFPMTEAERDALDTTNGHGMVVLVEDGAQPGLYWWNVNAVPNPAWEKI